LKKLVQILFFILLNQMVFALPGNNTNEFKKQKTDAYIQYVYNKLSFKKVNKLSYAAFYKGFYGYLNIKEAGKIKSTALLTICDFTLSSNTKRLWVIDIQKKKVLFNTLVAHGMGTGEEFATKFSNTPDSHQSSLGFYLTGETYMGDNGYSLKLEGIDGAFNNNAFERAIVIHGADYVSASFAAGNNRLGRSHGCPALPREVSEPIINKIANNSCLFIYHTQKNYLKTSYWLNNSIENLPNEADLIDLMQPQNIDATWGSDKVKIDSVSYNQAVILNEKQNKAIAAAKANAVLMAAKPTIVDSSKIIKPVVREREFLYMK
jgi:L,D-transpeptidase catalytic domain